jgi:methyltransferase-like protein
LSATVGEAPRATALARQQARASDRVTNQSHQTIVIHPFERALLGLLDGTRTRADLRGDLAESVVRGELKIEQDGKPLADRAAINAAVSMLVDNGLARLAQNALLVG